MELKINTRNLTLSETLQDYLEKKIGRMSRYLPSLTEAYVELSREETKNIQHRYRVEVTLRSSRAFIRAEERSADIFAAIDSVSDKLHRRINRYKGKLYDKSKARVRKEIMEEAPEEEYRVVRVKRFAVSPMSPEEAIEQMELLGHDFFVFLDAEDGQISVLYRRKNGNYGVIKPEVA